MLERYKIDINGIVQGVGFRPFIYRLATRYRLYGFVKNTSEGVTIEAQGESNKIAQFTEAIKNELPPAAIIQEITEEQIQPLQDASGFTIISSTQGTRPETLISPDIATCDDCLREMRNPNDRRYRYPFINCTNCGPRYTIIEDIPYDRPMTSMKCFPMCPDCKAEYADPLDRRFHAQPDACWKCGPKLVLIDTPHPAPLPQGRLCRNSKMCHSEEGTTEACPADRREARESSIPRHFNGRSFASLRMTNNCDTVSGDREKTGDEAILHAVRLLKEGRILATKGLGGFHLACDATNEDAVKRLRSRKYREEKPFAVMMPDVATIKQFCHLSNDEETLLTSPQRPIVLLKKLNTNAARGIADEVAPGNAFLGVMLPYTPVHHLLFMGHCEERSATKQSPEHPSSGDCFAHARNDHILKALVMTSGNISDEPIAYTNDDAINRLKDIADNFLLHDRDIFIQTDDSILRLEQGRPIFLRRSRGYAPQPIRMDYELPEILGVGAEIKNTVCLTRGKNAFLSQHIGDLENAITYEAFEKTIQHMKDILGINPSTIACDMHPGYFSTQWAEKQTGHKLIKVQHHHAHIATCMAEHHIEDDVIGISLDGTGYGTDGNIWGGEILLANRAKFKRLAHLEYVPLPGGSAGIKHPWQMAVSYLHQAMNLSDPTEIKSLVPAFKKITDEKISNTLKIIDQRINTPMTSSCGRLFDAVSAIIGLHLKSTFEGQAAMGLEMAGHIMFDYVKSPLLEGYSFDIYNNNGVITIGYRSLFKALVEDIRSGVSSYIIAVKFHNTLARALTEVCKSIKEPREVALSGGCFQNVILTFTLKKYLEDAGFSVYTHRLTPPNDGGLALGQAVVAGSIVF